MEPSSLLGLALSQLFGLAKPLVGHAALGEVRAILDGRVDNCAANDERDGWTWDHVADSKNDYKNPDGTPGDSRSKRIDNMLFLMGKQLPGDATDFIRDHTSPVITPRLRAVQDVAWTATDLAQHVADELFIEAEKLAGQVP